MPFFGGKNRVFLLKTKKGNEPKKKKTKKKKPKENKPKKQIRRV